MVQREQRPRYLVLSSKPQKERMPPIAEERTYNVCYPAFVICFLEFLEPL